MKSISLKISAIAVIISTLFWNTNIFAQPGTLDLSFNAGSGLWPVHAIGVQNDNKIILGGCFYSYNSIISPHLVRINLDGTIDTTFYNGFDNNTSITAIAIQDDNKILVGGTLSYYDSIPIKTIIRFDQNGRRDTSFNYSWITDPINSIIIKNNKIYIAGFDLVRLNMNGTRDVTFTTFINFGQINKLQLQNDSSFLILSNNNILTRLFQNGIKDSSFIMGDFTYFGDNYVINDFFIQNDGKIIVVGSFNSYYGNDCNNIVRLNIDGSIDSTFNIGTGTNGTINCAAIQNNGKIIICGDFTYYNDNHINRIARLNSDGSLDQSFNSGYGTDYPIIKVAVLNNDKLLITGDFYSYNNEPVYNIALINSGEINVPYNSLNNEVVVFPNPMHNDLYIQSEKLLQSDYEIYSIEGKMVQNGTLNDFNSRIDVSSLKNGIYILNIEGDKIKIAKQ